MQARALYDYQASLDNPNELSFKKEDIFDVIHSSGKCWEVEVADGSTGMVPSNFIRRHQRVRMSKFQTSPVSRSHSHACTESNYLLTPQLTQSGARRMKSLSSTISVPASANISTRGRCGGRLSPLQGPLAGLGTWARRLANPPWRDG